MKNIPAAKSEEVKKYTVQELKKLSLNFEQLLQVLSQLGMLDLNTIDQRIILEQSRQVETLWQIVHDYYDEEIVEI